MVQVFQQEHNIPPTHQLFGKVVCLWRRSEITSVARLVFVLWKKSYSSMWIQELFIEIMQIHRISQFHGPSQNAAVWCPPGLSSSTLKCGYDFFSQQPCTPRPNSRKRRPTLLPSHFRCLSTNGSSVVPPPDFSFTSMWWIKLENHCVFLNCLSILNLNPITILLLKQPLSPTIKKWVMFYFLEKKKVMDKWDVCAWPV